MDGSAAPFVFLLQEAGILEQAAPRKYIKIKKAIQVGTDDKCIKITPAEELSITYTINFNHPLINTQKAHYALTEATFTRKISRARTFGFLHEAKQLREAGLIKGGSLDNAIVVGDYHILNGSLRFEDEFVCHKIIDFIGDLYLLGRPIIGHVTAYKAGHGLHSLLVKEIAKHLHAWEFTPAIEEVSTPEPKMAPQEAGYPYAANTSLAAVTIS
jgi:UDP-3-O-[3-hydroxymyristoyl] N-acetylglucosamine deacetylase